jgi:flagellar protein FliO/FliZ
VIFPQGNSSEDSSSPLPADRRSGRSWGVLIAALLLGSAGAWFLIKRRPLGRLGAAKGDRKIQIEETRSLGNRQYLVVADYEGSKFLIGVTPGQIQIARTV